MVAAPPLNLFLDGEEGARGEGGFDDGAGRDVVGRCNRLASDARYRISAQQCGLRGEGSKEAFGGVNGVAAALQLCGRGRGKSAPRHAESLQLRMDKAP